MTLLRITAIAVLTACVLFVVNSCSGPGNGSGGNAAAAKKKDAQSIKLSNSEEEGTGTKQDEKKSVDSAARAQRSGTTPTQEFTTGSATSRTDKKEPVTIIIDELCGGGELKTTQVKNPLLDAPGSVYSVISLEKEDHICIEWSGSRIKSINVYALEPIGTKIRLASFRGGAAAGNRKELVIPRKDLHLYKYFNVIAAGMNDEGKVVASAGSRALTFVENAKNGMADDFSKIFTITNMGYDAYGGNAGCGRHALELYRLARKYGFTPRMVDINFSSWGDTHVFEEIFVRSMNKWVAFDSTFSVYYTVGAKPANVFEMHEALVNGKVESMGYVPYKDSIKRLEGYYINPRYLFKNIAVGIFDNNPGNSFCYSDEYSLPWSRCARKMATPELWYLPPERIRINNKSIIFQKGKNRKSFTLDKIRMRNPVPADGRLILKKKYCPLNEPFRSLVYHKKQFLENGDFEKDADSDGVADGWTVTGAAGTALTDMHNFVASGRKAQYIKFGHQGGKIVIPIPVKDAYDDKLIFHLTGFALVKTGSARIDIVPATGSCCTNGDIYQFSQRYSPGNWNFLMSSGFHLDQAKDRTLVITGAPDSELFLDDFRLYQLKR